MRAKFIFEQFDSFEYKEKFKDIFNKEDLKDLVKNEPYKNKFNYGGYHGKDSAELNKIINQRATSWGYKELDTQAISEVAYRLLIAGIPFLRTWTINQSNGNNPAHYLNIQKHILIPDPKDELDRPFQAEVNIWVTFFAKSDEILDYEQGKLKILVSMQVRSQEKGGLLWDIGKNSKKGPALKDKFKPKKGSCEGKNCQIDWEDVDNEKILDDLMSRLSEIAYGQADDQDKKISEKLKISEKNISLDDLNKLIPEIKKNFEYYDNYLKAKYDISLFSLRESLEGYLSYENQLFESVLNEKFDIENFKRKIANVRDKHKLVDKLLTQLKAETTSYSIKKNIGMALILVYLVSLGIKNNKWEGTKNYYDSLENAASELVSQEVTTDTIKNKALEISQENDIFREPSSLRASNEIINFIKKHEGLRLEAYNLGDGKITIGYGHTGGNFKVGDKITKEQAQELFQSDLKKKEIGLQRMFSQWAERGNDIQISQNMYDALLSMSYNIGLKGLRNTEFIEHVEQEDFMAAAEKIKNTKVSKKFPGLEKRRKAEYELFSKDLI